MDFIFYPYDLTADGIILELKVDHTPEEAIQQIKDRKYALKILCRGLQNRKSIQEKYWLWELGMKRRRKSTGVEWKA